MMYSNYSEVIFSSLRLMLFHVAAEKGLTAPHFRANYNSWSFEISGFIMCYFENRILFKPVLGDKASVAHFITGYEQAQLNRVPKKRPRTSSIVQFIFYVLVL